MHDFVKVSQLAAKQAGVVSRAQLVARGVTPSALFRAHEQGLLVPHQHPGVYRLASAVVGRATHLHAALLWAGDGAVLSHVTAGWHWKLEGLGKKPPDVIDVSVLNTTRLVPKKNVHVWRTRTLVAIKDYAPLSGIPCTSLARTLIDLAAVLDKRALEHAYDSAVRRSAENRTALFDAIRRLGTRGRRGIQALIDIATREELGPTHSWLENETRQVMREAKIRLPLPQLEVRDRNDKFICRPDFVWPGQMVALFCDSWEHHGDKRARFELDPVQRNQLGLAGWLTLAVTHRRLLRDPNGFIGELKQALGHSE
ncbi:MAG: type IV toxin-antitoxin system AbiEi family antitoxin domain-containing protein [Myxococcaceae bacterium]|nr:type IV toxin-antitoxin system AbiEi family antitoxin domain-containing protein [Myxococcaceae bacterium]